MCECKKDIEAKLLERFKQHTPEAKDHDVELKGYGVSISNLDLKLCAFMPIEYIAKYPMKGGVLHKERKTKSTMHFNFFPFCGESFEKGGVS